MSMSAEEKKRIFLDVLAQMKQHTWCAITQICGAFDDNSGELLGTGTLIECRGDTYLLTAEHVARCQFAEKLDGSRKYESGLCHSVGNGQRMMYVTNPWTSWSQPKDLAVSRIDPVVLQQTDRLPLSPDAFATDSHGLTDDIYFIHGFPGKRSRFTAFGPGVVSTSLPYGGWLENSTWSGFDPHVHFAMTYPRQEIVDERELATDLPDPGGLSGSTVWKTNRAGAGADWTPNQARVVGVAHRYDQDSQCLIVTRIEYIRGLLMHVLRSEYAYFRWIERGSPLWDDLDDWVAAEKRVRSLSCQPEPPSRSKCLSERAIPQRDDCETNDLMGYERISTSISEFERLCSSLYIEIPERSPFKRNVDLVREFMADMQADSEEAVQKWMQLPFDKWYWPMLSVEKLSSAVSQLRNHPDDLTELVPLAVIEDIKQDFEPSQSKTYFYELQVAAWFQQAGFEITFDEPDVRIKGNGLSKQIGLACKYPSSENKLDKRISEGYDQIDRQGVAGLVVIGMDILCCRGMKKFVRFPDSKQAILGSMANELSKWVTKTIKRRAGVKGRRPLSGAIFTLSMAGIYGKPAGLTVVSQMTFQSEQGNSLNSEIAVIAEAMGRLGG